MSTHKALALYLAIIFSLTGTILPGAITPESPIDSMGDEPKVLALAAANHNAAIIELLLQRNTAVNVQNEEGLTPLLLNLRALNIPDLTKQQIEDIPKITKLLLENGADPNIVPANEPTPLEIVAASPLFTDEEKREIIDLFIEKGAKTDVAPQLKSQTLFAPTTAPAQTLSEQYPLIKQAEKSRITPQ